MSAGRGSIYTRIGMGSIGRVKMGGRGSQMDPTWLLVHMWARKLQNSIRERRPFQVQHLSLEGMSIS